MTTSKFDEMLAFVQQKHAGQFRNKERQTPYWMHCYGVALILRAVCERHGLDSTDLVLAALGHDLYEDTDATRQEVADRFGAPVDELIFTLTNEDGDDNRSRYMQKLAASGEGTILIKMADMIDNLFSVYHNADILGEDWITSFFLPIMDDSIAKVRAYQNYSQAGQKVADSLIGVVEAGYVLLNTYLRNGEEA